MDRILGGLDVGKTIQGLKYPASKQEIIAMARDKGVGENILGMLEKVPERVYTSAADLLQSMEHKG